jgi:hypothetical protein
LAVVVAEITHPQMQDDQVVLVVVVVGQLFQGVLELLVKDILEEMALIVQLIHITLVAVVVLEQLDKTVYFLVTVQEMVELVYHSQHPVELHITLLVAVVADLKLIQQHLEMVEMAVVVAVEHGQVQQQELAVRDLMLVKMDPMVMVEQVVPIQVVVLVEWVFLLLLLVVGAELAEMTQADI